MLSDRSMEQIYILFFLGIISCAVVFGVGPRWWFLDGQDRWAAYRLRTRFQILGDLRGKTLAEISAVVGKPNNVVPLPDNKFSYSWHDGHKYHITLRFKDDICQGVVSELFL